ncbi:MAG: UDP-N-acetylmuramoyl-L-alanyl-D-glutamate--2,6-diaminopimelate ligase [Actinomycetota bacterium]
MTTDGPRTVSALATATGDLTKEIRGDAAIEVTGVAYDSRAVRPGDLFFCVPGATTDGHEFAAAAANAGAVALCVERPTGAGIIEIEVSDARRAMARISAAFYGNPSADMLVLGVTGTNGKTTTVYLLDSILAAAGHTTGLIGTIETRVAGEVRPGVRTTPESRDLQALFAEMRDRSVGAVAMEVTSHALAMHRVEGVRYAAAAFTNLSQDHLDFHADMDDYFAAKRGLFVAGRTERAAINSDDPWGRRLLEQIEDVPAVAYGVAEDADVRASDVGLRADGSEFVLHASGAEVKIVTTLIGAFNVYNCLAAAATAVEAGIELDAVERGIATLEAVPGRFEAISMGQPFAVIVDYAHTPDSLDNVLRAARRLSVAGEGEGRVLCAFGCGGDRDRLKRPLMGSVVARLADVAIVTSDNPRSEDPMAIIDEILEGVIAESPTGPDAVLPDRREAIRHAIAAALPGDVVVIAGKGHESGQEFADRMIPFDDRDEARAALRDAGWGGAA